MKIKRRESGIDGLDPMLTGGFPVPSTVLTAGAPGTGKTTFAVQYLFHGAKNDELSLYITALSEPQWVVQRFLSEFSFYSQDLVDSGKIVFLDIGKELTDNPQEIESILESLVEKYSPKRMVIDPITPMLEVFKQHRLEREFMHRFFSYMKTIDCVTLITSEISYESIPNVLESYMVDGIILLSYPEEAGLRRKYLEILKMRGTKHTTGRQLMDITQNGIVVHAGLR